MPAGNPVSLIVRKTGNWWTDERRKWCAYCGVAIVGHAAKSGIAMRDHVLPRAHKGRHVTIPCCRECNQRKGNGSLAEFMLTDYFAKVRTDKNERRWPMRDLWLVMALAAVEQARDSEAVRPTASRSPKLDLPVG